MFGGGTDERQVMILDNLHETGVFRQKAIPGMDGRRAGHFAGGNDGGDRQVAVGRGGRSDADGFVCHAHMHRVGVRSGMHRDRRNAHLSAGTDDAQRDFTAVCDQDLVEHGSHSSITRGAPYSTGAPSSIRMRLTVPDRGAGMWFMVFIASTMSSVSPSLTCAPTEIKASAPGSDCM